MVDGKWNIALQTPLGLKQGVLVLHTHGAILSGSMSDGEHHVSLTDGKIEGNQLSWSAQLTKPMRANVKFTATVEAGGITGVARHFLGRATFIGSRAS